MAVVKVDIRSYNWDGIVYQDCRINITGPEIRFEYTWEDTGYAYVGYECPEAPGRYELTCAETAGRCTLYKLPGTDTMMGRWSEKGSGLWEIDLEE